MKVYVAQVPGGHDVEVGVFAVSARKALMEWGDFDAAAVDVAEATGAYYDDHGASLAVAEVDTPVWTVIVTWSEPEQGIAVYGPYASEEEASAARPAIERDFTNEGELPGDVEFGVLEAVAR